MTSRPSIVLVDDDNEVLRSIEADVKARYGGDYRVLTAGSGSEALDLAARLTLRSDPIALVMADQRMPSMTGTEMLDELRERVPGARRVLLTAYADTDAAIDAINEAGVDYYILKPWDPPEERLYPVLDDLLEEWQSRYTPDDALGIKVIGDRWSQRSFELRDFLTRNHVPFRWLEMGASAEAARLVASADGAVPPVVITESGSVISDASGSDTAASSDSGSASDSDTASSSAPAAASEPSST